MCGFRMQTYQITVQTWPIEIDICQAQTGMVVTRHDQAIVGVQQKGSISF